MRLGAKHALDELLLPDEVIALRRRQLAHALLELRLQVVPRSTKRSKHLLRWKGTLLAGIG
jgi:hypothetical protein